MGSVEVETANNDCLIRMIGEDVQLECPSTAQIARVGDLLRSKVVLLYFSSSRCQPCRQFHPLLENVYSSLKQRGENVEIVCCSSDKTSAEFKESSRSMPWWSLSPIAYPTVQRKLSCYYGVQGIPHLVVIGMDGKVVIDDGVDSVQADPGGLQFPWKPPNLTGLLPSNYLSSDKTSRGSLRDLDHKYIILYFGAAWSPPCQHITPIVSDAFIRLQGCRDDFEMLFVSCDYEQCAFDACWKEMSFGALPFADRETQSRLLSRLRIREIPTLVSLGPIDPATGDRPVINANVRRFFEDGSYADAFPYVPILFGDFNLCRENINTLQAVIVFCEYADDHEHLAVKEAVRNASDQCQWGGLRFYWAVDSTPMTETFREALRIGRGAMGQDPCVVLLDIPDGGSFYVHYAKEVTSDSILGFIASPGERQQL